VNYGVTFPMMAKIDVNGDEADPLFRWLTGEAPGFLGMRGIKWNFTKFLIGRDGEVVERFSPKDEPAKMRKAIEEALGAAPA
jgi:glutathione peroxidase